jgi:DNA-binding IclR family transcriptional regulator
MVGAPKSTVHLALTALLASGVVAKVGEALVLRS